MRDSSLDPRVDATLFNMSRDIGAINSTILAMQAKVTEVHKAIYGNGRPGVIERLISAENNISRLLGQTVEHRKHTLKVAGWTSGALTAIVLALKLTIYLVTGHWPPI